MTTHRHSRSTSVPVPIPKQAYLVHRPEASGATIVVTLQQRDMLTEESKITEFWEAKRNGSRHPEARVELSFFYQLGKPWNPKAALHEYEEFHSNNTGSECLLVALRDFLKGWNRFDDLKPAELKLGKNPTLKKPYVVTKAFDVFLSELYLIHPFRYESWVLRRKGAESQEANMMIKCNSEKGKAGEEFSRGGSSEATNIIKKFLRQHGRLREDSPASGK